jgi:hypothetical protein
VKLQTCRKCGRPSAGPRCPRHLLRRRARGNAFEPTRQRIARRDRWTCTFCGEAIDPSLRKPDPYALAIHHDTRRADGGDERDSNLHAAHAICNMRAG